jgi:protocatechuate 3,4-dioxygenase beta subunit
VHTDPVEPERRFSRRGVLAWAGGFGLAALLPGCGEEGGGDAVVAPTTAATPTATGTAPDCVLMPELTEGPYYLDLDLVRRDITEDRPGAPLELAVTVVDADSCSPIAGAAVDVWHCDARGAYSGVQTDSGTFLRGIQTTGDDGVASFETVYPGWYQGRAVHIHVKVHVGGDEEHTGQLFFDDALTASVYEAEPYAERGEPDTPSDADGIYAQSEGSTIVAVERAGDGYAGTVTLGVRAT